MSADPHRHFRASAPKEAVRRDLRLRLLPAVAGAAGALLMLKAFEISSTGYEPSRLAQLTAAVVAAAHKGQKDPETTGSTAPAKKKDEKADKPDKPDKSDKSDKSGPPPGPTGTPVNLDQPTAVSAAEKSLLQRLGERREQLDDRQRELDTRENLLKAADKKLEARINELKDLEARGGVTANPDGSLAPAGSPGAPGAPNAPPPAGGLKNIVTMYEAMKPKDAAKVFDRLDMRVLVPVVNAMNPRKMSEILAAMSPEAAEKLTVELARGSVRTPVAAAAREASLPVGELPAIDPRKP